MDSENFTFYAMHEAGPAVADAWGWGLQELGHNITPPGDETPPGEIHLFFGLPDAPLKELLASMPRAILVNLAPLVGSLSRFETGAGTIALMRNVPVCDTSRPNIDVLRAAGITDISHVPIGYAPVLERIAPRDKDLDVVCLQRLDQRRREILRSLQARGLKVASDPEAAWSQEESDAHIARARLVLQFIQNADIDVFDETRAGFLLANHAAVVAELGPATLIEDDMRECVAGASLADLPALCMALCADTARRQALADHGYATFRARQWLPQLEQMIATYAARNPERSAALKVDVAPPRRLNIGSGKTWKHDFVNIDIDPTRGADLVFDLNTPFPFDDVHDTWRFGKARFAKGHFEYILAEHVFEHVRELIQCVTTCMHWLADGGTLEVEVPYDLSYGAWQDPTHIRGFNERSWLYYTDWCWYVGWREHRFDLFKNVFQFSEIGTAMHARGIEDEVILRTPRAVDAMRATFRKRALTDAEKEAHRSYFRTVS